MPSVATIDVEMRVPKVTYNGQNFSYQKNDRYASVKGSMPRAPRLKEARTTLNKFIGPSEYMVAETDKRNSRLSAPRCSSVFGRQRVNK
jgi:hypothetical protein